MGFLTDIRFVPIIDRFVMLHGCGLLGQWDTLDAMFINGHGEV